MAWLSVGQQVLNAYWFFQTGRARKCSIVQEEDDDEDETEPDDLQNSLNRRGSRSEGRINIAVQDRIAESEMLKKDMAIKTVNTAMAPTRGLFDGIAGVTLVSSNDNSLKEKLGRMRNAGGNMRRPMDFRPRTAAPATPTTDANATATNRDTQDALEDLNHRSNSVDYSYNALNRCRDSDTVSTKFLTDSSTISIPIANNQPNMADMLGQPKYKTMPSPTRANTILPGTNCLNEIFEEGTDVGSSDTSTTTTPRPVARHTTFTNARATTSAAAGGSTQRRTKFHKTRTASCSSSDDDDSENRKKRAHKIVDSHHKTIQTQRRDSNDDSSDSQDPGSGATAGSNSSSQCSIQAMVGATCNDQSENSSNQTNGGGSTSNGTQKSGQIGYRRHRNGRRRTGETRLRESQSLNRITEVQESESPLSLANQCQNAASPNRAPPVPDATAATSPTTQQPAIASSKPAKMGFSARLFHGFRKSDAHKTHDSTQVPSHNDDTCAINSNTKNSTSTTSINSNTTSTDDVEIASEIAKAIKSSTEGKSSAAAKKLKLLGKYFQVSIDA